MRPFFFNFVNFYLDISNRSCKKSTRISYVPFTQVHQLFTFFFFKSKFALSFHVLYVYAFFFSELFEISWRPCALLPLVCHYALWKDREMLLNNPITMVRIRKIEKG